MAAGQLWCHPLIVPGCAGTVLAGLQAAQAAVSELAHTSGSDQADLGGSSHLLGKTRSMLQTRRHRNLHTILLQWLRPPGQPVEEPLAGCGEKSYHLPDGWF